MISLRGVGYAYPFQNEAAVRDVHLRVRPGELALCTGPSGCGKSTLVRLINGLCPHYFKGRLEGAVAVDGKDNATRRLAAIARDVGALFQDPELQFFATTVEDEIAFAHEWRAEAPQAVRRAVEEAAERFGVGRLLSASIQDLSEGEKQLTALASILSLRPKALVLDEPSANLDPEATMRLAGILGELKEQGMAIFVADHRLYWLEGVADRVFVMDRGRVQEEGDFSLLRDEALRERHGLRRATVNDPRPVLPAPSANGSGLTAQGLSFAYKHCPAIFDNADFQLPNAVIGVIGENGVGKTTLARLLTGLLKPRRGVLRLDGVEVSGRGLLARSSLVLQNADHQLYMTSVRKELAVAAGKRDKAETAMIIANLLESFNLAHLAERHPQSLSGGEKQRLAIACGLAKTPRALILDEPTSGLDGRNMALIAQAVRSRADQGACVLLISHDLELLGQVCDAALRLPIEPQAART